jgi:hypothetical protein
MVESFGLQRKEWGPEQQEAKHRKIAQVKFVRADPGPHNGQSGQ